MTKKKKDEVARRLEQVQQFERNLLEENLIGIETNIEECYVNNIFTNKF